MRSPVILLLLLIVTAVSAAPYNSIIKRNSKNSEVALNPVEPKLEPKQKKKQKPLVPDASVACTELKIFHMQICWSLQGSFVPKKLHDTRFWDLTQGFEIELRPEDYKRLYGSSYDEYKRLYGT